MKKTNKILITLILIGIFILLGNTKSQASDLYLTNLDFNVQVHQDGSMDVTENWDISVENTNTLFKTFKTDSTKYGSISNVKVSEITGGTEKAFTETNSLMYHVTKDYYYGLKNSDGNFEIAWGVGLDDSSANKKYKISYKVNNAIAKYNDYAELYWQFIGSDFEINCKKITGTILLPQNAEMKEDIKVWGHTEGLNGEIYVTDLNKIEFTIDRFYAGTYVEIRSLFPTNMITYSGRTYSTDVLDDVISEETVWADEANARREKLKQKKSIISNLFIVICAILDIALIKKSIETWKKASDKEKFVPTVDFEYYRELPRKDATPAQAVFEYGEFIDKLSTTYTGNVFSATLLDLSLKKFISFEKNPTNEKNLIINIDKDKVNDKLEGSEKAVLTFVLEASAGKGKTSIKELEKYMKSHSSKLIYLKEKIETNAQKELQKKGLYDKEQAEEKDIYDKAATAGGSAILVTFFIMGGLFPIMVEYINWKTLLIGIISVIGVLIFRTVAISRYKKRINVYTQQGIDEKQMWRGLKKYMNDFSMLDKREIPELVIWEHFLVYATAFGMADRVIKQLKALYKEMGRSMDFDDSYGYMYYMMNYDFTSTFTNSLTSSFNSAYSSNYSSSYSSGSGGGGGFSGGGGGGRRPEEAAEADKGTKRTKSFGPFLYL